MKTISTLNSLSAAALIAGGHFIAAAAAIAQQSPALADLPLPIRDARTAEIEDLLESAMSDQLVQNLMKPKHYITATEFTETGACRQTTKGAATSGRTAPAGCILLETPKKSPVFTATVDGITLGGGANESFTICGRKLYSFGLELKPPAEGTILKIQLKREGAQIYSDEYRISGGQEFIGVWSYRWFDQVVITEIEETREINYTAVHSGCRPRTTGITPFEHEVRRSSFLNSTGAVSAGSWPASGASPVMALGPLTFMCAGSASFHVGSTFFGGIPTPESAEQAARRSQALALLPDGWMGMDTEAFNVCMSGPVHSFGFEMVEPTEEFDTWALGNPLDEDGNVILDTNGPEQPGGERELVRFKESTFVIRLYRGEVQVGTDYTFKPRNNGIEFWGIRSFEPFTRVEIRETDGGAENEIFGRFFVSDPCGCGCGEKPSAK